MPTAQKSTSGPLHYHVILLGKAGAGKSASGNTIAKRTVFTSMWSSSAVTKDVQMERVTVDGVVLDVYDTPGLFSPGVKNEDVLRQWQPLLDLDPSIPTVFLLVIKAGRFTPEERETVEMITQFVPNQLLQNTWILFTRGDELDKENVSIDDFIKDTQELKRVVQRFENRHHVFNNKVENHDQVRRLINKIVEPSPVTHHSSLTSLGTRMVFQVIIWFGDENKPITVAETEAQALRTTVRGLKDLFIRTSPGAPDPDNIKLTFGNKLLEDNRMLGDYHIRHCSFIIAVMRMPAGDHSTHTSLGTRMVFQVIIMFDGENKPITVAPTEAQALRTTVRELKELLIKTLPAAPDPDRIRLVFGDEQLEDGRMLGDYHIRHHSLIIAVMRMAGGVKQ